MVFTQTRSALLPGIGVKTLRNGGHSPREVVVQALQRMLRRPFGPCCLTLNLTVGVSLPHSQILLCIVDLVQFVKVPCAMQEGCGEPGFPAAGGSASWLVVAGLARMASFHRACWRASIWRNRAAGLRVA